MKLGAQISNTRDAASCEVWGCKSGRLGRDFLEPKAMWQHVLAHMECKWCKLCKESVPDMQLEHCFLRCPATRDLRSEAELTELTLKDIKDPKPQEFPQILAFVADVLERHRGSDLEGNAESSEEGKDPVEQIVEPQHSHQQTHERSQPLLSATCTASASLEECKTLHLVLYPKPKRLYDDSPLGPLKEKILQEVASNQVTIIVAPTGCGKSTGRSLGFLSLFLPLLK